MISNKIQKKKKKTKDKKHMKKPNCRHFTGQLYLSNCYFSLEQFFSIM